MTDVGHGFLSECGSYQRAMGKNEQIDIKALGRKVKLYADVAGVAERHSEDSVNGAARAGSTVSQARGRGCVI